ncbi:type II secretory pathway protein [Bowmanella denitrificans]|uniref:type II secretory pathway protein n=1 Tax=Bowmanella denitrificans TaxID=366582 RepID=UPI0011AF47B6|nr:type II secretory pathway protein [Bowmanella denitrificans]
MITLFVLVVMALLGFALTRILSASSDTIVTEVYGVRALQAAKSGLESQLVAVFPLGVAGGDPNGCAPDTGYQPIQAAGLVNCSVRSLCQTQEYPIAGVRYYRFSAEGACEAGDAVVSRRLSIDARVSL